MEERLRAFMGLTTAQARAHGGTVPARVVGDAGAARLRVVLDEPHHGVAIGQSLALYDRSDAHCLGGGRIVAADRPVHATRPAPGLAASRQH